MIRLAIIVSMILIINSNFYCYAHNEGVKRTHPHLKSVLDTACIEGRLFLAYDMVSMRLDENSNNEDKSNSSSDDNDKYDAQTLAGLLHSKSALALITNGNYDEALKLHRFGKNSDSTLVPPLAKLHLDQYTCGGISDIFFVTAVIIKQTIDKLNDLSESNIRASLHGATAHSDQSIFTHMMEGFQTLITLTSDSGLHRESKNIVNKAIELLEIRKNNNNIDSDITINMEYLNAMRYRAALLTPAVYENKQHLYDTRYMLINNIQLLANITYTNDRDFPHNRASSSSSTSISLNRLDEFVISPTFYYVYQGFHDKPILKALHRAYNAANSDLGKNHLESIGKYPVAPTPLPRSSAHDSSSSQSKASASPVRIGFVSAHFRRHSICKLFCGVITNLASSTTLRESSSQSDNYIITLFSALQENKEDSYTLKLINSLKSNSFNNKHEFIRIGKTLVSNRYEVLNRNIDILIYLDVGMDPATMIWAGARLAPVQACLWGHPTTTGMEHMDYFISSDAYHIDNDMNLHHYIPKLMVNYSNKGKDKIDHQLNNISTIPIVTEYVKPGSMYDPSPFSTLQYERYTEQLVLFESLGFYFERPILPLASSLVSHDANNDMKYNIELLWKRNNEFYSRLLKGNHIDHDISKDLWAPSGLLKEIIEQRSKNEIKLILCPQHVPKLHYGLDKIFKNILKNTILQSNTKLILIIDGIKKGQWKRTLLNRWKRTMDADLIKRIVFLENLKPYEYLALLSIGDLMLDPFPFGGGVTTLESLAVCTPVITLPSEQTVVALAAGQLRKISSATTTLSNDDSGDNGRYLSDVDKWLIPNNYTEYINNAVSLINGHSDTNIIKNNNNDILYNIRKDICLRTQRLYDDSTVLDDWINFISRQK